MLFIGQGKGQTIIKLQDNLSVFNGSTAKAIIKNDGGNYQFRNYIRDMTISVGSNNSKAIALDYMANNSGGLINLEIRFEDGKGEVGLDFTKPWPGPMIIKDVEINGFNYGMRFGNAEYSVTMENITLKNQKVRGILNEGNILLIRKLTSENTVTAIESSGGSSMITLLESNLTGGTNTEAVHIKDGQIYARNISSTGYASTINFKGNKLTGIVNEYVSGTITSSFESPQKSLNLPVEDAPTFSESDPSKWALYEFLLLW